MKERTIYAGTPLNVEAIFADHLNDISKAQFFDGTTLKQEFSNVTKLKLVFENLSPGEHFIKVVAFDTAGNSRTESIQVLVQ
jgi:hypothetical protein